MSPMLWLQRSHLLVVPTYVNLAMSRKAHSQSSRLLSVPTIARVRKVPEFERAVPVVSQSDCQNPMTGIARKITCAHYTWVRCLRHTGIPTFATKPLAWMTCIGPGNFFHNGCPVRDPGLNLFVFVLLSIVYITYPPPMRRIIARLLQYTITRLFMPATVPYYCLTLMYGTLYTPLYLKGNKKLDRARVPKFKKKE